MDWQSAQKDGTRAMDAFTNALARTGFGTSNLLEGSQYPLTRLTRNYILMQSLYRSNWIARKVIDCIAEDMLKNWIQVVSELKPEQIDKFDRAIDATGTQEKLLTAIKWARLFGGAGAIMIIEGEDDLSKPLQLEEVPLHGYKGLLVFDRWSGITPSAEVCNDITRPEEFGLPASYRITTETASSYDVHASRVLRFTGRSLPQWEWQAEQRWGISEYEVIYDELKKRDNTSWNIASLIFRANILALKQKGLSEALSGIGKSQQALQNFYTTLQAQTHLMSNQGLMVLPEEGGLETHQYGFNGINDVYVSFMLDICGACEIPMSRLFGRSVTGLGQTGEGDEHIYYDLIGQKQKRELNPQLKKLFPVIAMSELGHVPDDFDWQFNTVRSLSNEEQADLASKKGTAIVEGFNAGIYGRKTALKEYKAISEETNITDDMISKADDDVMSPMEMMGEESIGGDNPTGKGEIPKTPNSKPKKAKDSVLEYHFAGLDIVIENPAGSIRRGVNARGQEWMVTMTYPYGYILRSEGVDGDAVDCFVGPFEAASHAYVIHTQDPLTGAYDEDKVMLGFPSAGTAIEAFLQNYSSPDFFRSLDAVPMRDFAAKVLGNRGTKLTVDSEMAMA
jgi:phage-related protein (TIGR01555 family)